MACSFEPEPMPVSCEESKNEVNRLVIDRGYGFRTTPQGVASASVHRSCANRTVGQPRTHPDNAVIS
jgi:hypothetical protein